MYSKHGKLVLPFEVLDHGLRSTSKSFADRFRLSPKESHIPRIQSTRSLGQALRVDGLPDDSAPLICFINCKSGGNQGSWLYAQLCRFLNPYQVFDFGTCNPLEVLRAFSVLPSFRVLVAGGDGSVGWIQSCIDDLRLDPRPPIAILPLGTGNDLARTLGWGAGYENEPIPQILACIQNAQVTVMDRWVATFSGRRKKKLVFNNYFGIGVDAQTTLKFHGMRETSPGLFFHRFVNKTWYTLLGLSDLMKFVNFF